MAASESTLAALTAFAEHAAAALRDDERVRVVWLTGSLAAGTADAQSDVDLRAAVRAEDFAIIGEWWQELVDRIAPTVWTRRWPGPPDEAITSAITRDYRRFDLVIQSVLDTRPRAYEAAQLLFDKDGTAQHITLTAPARHNPLARLPYLVEEYIRLLGMLPIVVERNDVAMGMEGQMGLHTILISLLLMENGVDRMATGKRHVAAFLNDEQCALLAQVPPLEPTMDSVMQGRVAYGRLFLPRARRLMESYSLTYPTAFEEATRRHLQDTLGLSL